MSLNLGRCELTQTATVSHRGTLALFPLGKKKKQKFVIGDDGGAVKCFEMKRGEAIEVFNCQTQSSEPIQNITLNMNPSKRDRVFASQGQCIFGVSKKGKEVFRLVAPSTESIKTMIVEDLRIYTGCEFIFQLYDNSKDVGYLMCQDRINALVTLPGRANTGQASSPDCLLACGDKRLRLVRTESDGSTVLCAQHHTDSEITALVPYGLSNSGDDGTLAASHAPKSGGDHQVYGTADGKVGIMSVYETYVDQHVKMDNSGDTSSGSDLSVSNHRKGSGISMLCSHDITGDGMAEVMVAREDGLLQVLQVSQNKSKSGSISTFNDMKVIFEASLNESIQGLTCGTVSSSGYEEVMCLTYSGKLCSFTNESLDKADEGDVKGRSVKTNRDETTLRVLSDDLEQLKAQLKQEQARLKSGASPSHASSGAARAGDSTQGSIAHSFAVLSRIELDVEEGAYGIHIEVPLPLDMITLTSTVRLDLLDSNNQSSTSSRNGGVIMNGIIGMSPPTESKPVLATFRFPEPSQRAQIRYRTNEGESGEVTLAVVANTNPKKVCQIIKFHVKPLSLHHRVHVLPSMEAMHKQQEEMEKLEARERLAMREQESKDQASDNSEGVMGNSSLRQSGSQANDALFDESETSRLNAYATEGDSKSDAATAAALPLQTQLEMSSLKITGNFSFRMAHDWINACLPEVPPRASGGGQEESVELFYVNSFTHSELYVVYKAGYILLKSDSASSIAIIRDVIANKAHDLRVEIDLDNLKMNPLACVNMLTRLDPLLRYQLDIASKVGLIESLVEITVSEQAMNGCDESSSIGEKFPWLSKELQDILAQSDKLTEEFKQRPRALQYISGVLTDLFVDWFKFRGEDVRSKIPDLHNFLVSQYHFRGLLEIFGLQDSI